MKRRFTMLTAAALLAAPLASAPGLVSAQAKVCPAGEAKGNPDCVRPGVAKNMIERRAERRENVEHPVAHHVAVGKILDKDYKEITDFERLGLPRPNAKVAYWQVGERVVAVDRATREVLRIFNPG